MKNIFKKKQNNNNMFWSVNPNSNICFVQRKDIIEVDNKPESFFLKPKVIIITLMLCAALDLCMFYQLFSAATNENPISRFIETFVAMAGFDIGPIFLGYFYRKYKDGYNINKIILSLPLIAFVVTFVFTAYFRYTLKDTILTGSTYTMSGMSTITNNTNPAAFSYFIVGTFAPVVTSFISFFISYMTSNPLKTHKHKLESQIDLQKAKITQYKSILLEYEADQAFKSRIILDEKARFYTVVREAQDYGIYLCDYVREKIKEHLDDPKAINDLSKPACIKILQELEQTRNAVLTIQPPILIQDLYDADNDTPIEYKYSA